MTTTQTAARKTRTTKATAKTAKPRSAAKVQGIGTIVTADGEGFHMAWTGSLASIEKAFNAELVRLRKHFGKPVSGRWMVKSGPEANRWFYGQR